MGHAIHFLERLERVDDRHVERALLMYRSGAILKDVLKHVPLPDGAERLAVSLEHDTRGPFVILTREGRFITCLAEGMSVGCTPIVKRADFERASENVRYFHDEYLRIEGFERSHPDGEVARIWRRLERRGLSLTREDAERATLVLPLLCEPMMQTTVLQHQRVAKIASTLRRFHKKKGVPRKEFSELVASYEGLAWANANMLPFMGLDSLWGPTLAECRHEVGAARMSLAQACFGWGSGLHAYRGLWLALRAGTEELALLHEPDPDDWAGQAFYRLVHAGFEIKARCARVANDQSVPIAGEMLEASQLCSANAWFLSPRREAHYARIHGALERIVRAEFLDMFPTKAELKPRIVAMKPCLERWLHRYPSEPVPHARAGEIPIAV